MFERLSPCKERLSPCKHIIEGIAKRFLLWILLELHLTLNIVK